MNASTHRSVAKRAGAEGLAWLETVRQQIGSLRFGVVQITVHEGRVVQIDRTEKLRLVNPIAVSGRPD
jgi:hypothetical protein